MTKFIYIVSQKTGPLTFYDITSPILIEYQ